ncbi:hypothetical protein ACSBR1_017059 [Camellia fascicularis]
MSSRGAGSSRRQSGSKVWLLPPFSYDYMSEKYFSLKDYYAGAPVPHRRSLSMRRRNVGDYKQAINRIKKENNRMSLQRCRHFMLQLATEMAEASNRELTMTERNNVLNNDKYLSDYYMSDEE